jgi:hypothetical protein
MFQLVQAFHSSLREPCRSEVLLTAWAPQRYEPLVDGADAAIGRVGPMGAGGPDLFHI